jgi:PhnB protein
MKAAQPYLNFNGNTEEAFNFYKTVFGGEFAMVMRFGDGPDVCNNIPAGTENMIMHIALPIGDSMLMGTDAPEQMGFKLVTGNNTYIMLGMESKEETDDIFAKLSEGGKVEMAPQDTFWGAYYASFTDKFGIQWMLNYDPRYQ